MIGGLCMNDIILQVSGYYIFAVLLIVAILNIIQYASKKRYKRELEKLDVEKNQVIDAPIMTELSKVESLVGNESIKNKYDIWKQEITGIKKELEDNMNDLILEADFLVEQRKFKDYVKKRTIIEIRLYEMNKCKVKILEEMKEITLSEERNRITITDLKTKFRDVVHNFETAKSDFEPISKVLELQIENVEKRFQIFERSMDEKDYIEANKLVMVLDSMVRHLETIIDEIPGALLMANSLIPKRLEEVKSDYKTMLSRGYQLDYLNIEYNISEIEKKISAIMSRIRVLNLEDVLFELKTILEYTDSTFNDFEREKIARKSFEDATIVFKNKADKINEYMNKLYGKVVDTKYNYKLSENQLNSLNLLSENLLTLEEDFNKLCDTTRTFSFPYSRLNKELEILISKLSQIESELNEYISSIGSMQEDERRAREQLGDMAQLLDMAKFKIREYKLPVLPNNYFVQLEEAIEALREVVKELDQKPINIEVLNTRVDTARDLVFKVYNNSIELIKSTILEKNTIIYGNRYRIKKQYIDESLNKAEYLFLNGEYKKSLELSLNVVDSVEPGIYKKLLELYEKKST